MAKQEDKSNLLIGDYRERDWLGNPENFDKAGRMVLGSQKTRQMHPGLMSDNKRKPIVGTSTPLPTMPKPDTMLDKAMKRGDDD